MLEENEKYSFAPLKCEDAKILILGSIPGDRSIELGEYYGNSRNRFWNLISLLFEMEPPTTYLAKQDMLRCVKITLWDVAHTAIRKGSLDNDIHDEIPNDIPSLIEQCPTIKIIVFNGKKAEQLYDRYFERSSLIRYFAMPSTSPANAVCTLNKLYDRWTEIL